MRFERLHINHFGDLHNITLEMSDRLLLIQGNDAARDDLHACLEYISYGMTQEDLLPQGSYHRYLPLSGKSNYGGILEFTEDESTYSIYRNFSRSLEGCTLKNESDRRPVALEEDQVHLLLGGIPHALYRDSAAPNDPVTLSPEEYTAKVETFLHQLTTTGSGSLSLDSALERLNYEKETKQRRINTQAEERNRKIYAELSALHRQRVQLPKRESLLKVEKNAAELDHQITELREQCEICNQRIQENRSYLESHAQTSDDTLQNVERRSMRLLARREELLRSYPDPSKIPMREHLPLLSTLTTVGALFFLIAAVFFLGTQSWIPGGVFLVLTLATGALSLRFRSHLRAVKAFHAVDRSLRKLYRDLRKEAPDQIDSSSIDQFLETMARLRSCRDELDSNSKALAKAQAQAAQLEKQYHDLEPELHRLRAEFETKVDLIEKITLREEEASTLSRILTENQRLQQEIKDLELSIQTIRDLSSQCFLKLTSYLEEAASAALASMTGGRLDSLQLSTDRILVSSEGHTIPLTQAGPDAAAQVYLAVRVAWLVSFRQDGQLPLILNNCFLPCSDACYLESMTWITRNYPGQVLLFTENPRDQRLLEENGIEKKIIAL